MRIFLVVLALIIAPVAARAQTPTLIWSDNLSTVMSGAPWYGNIGSAGSPSNIPGVSTPFVSGHFGVGGNPSWGFRTLGTTYNYVRVYATWQVHDDLGADFGFTLYNSANGSVTTGGSFVIDSIGSPYLECATNGSSGSGSATCSAGASDGVLGTFNVSANAQHTFQMDVKISPTSSGTMTVAVDGTPTLNLTGITYLANSIVDTMIIGANNDGFSDGGYIGGMSVYSLSAVATGHLIDE